MLSSQFRNFKIIYRRYAGLYFCICVDVTDNNLAYLEGIHNFVEVTDTHSTWHKPGKRTARITSHDLSCFQECLLMISLRKFPLYLKINFKPAFLLRSDLDSNDLERHMRFCQHYFCVYVINFTVDVNFNKVYATNILLQYYNNE